MFKKIVSMSALALALAACETTCEQECVSDGHFDGKLVPGSHEHFTHHCGDRIHFATNSSNLTGEARGTLAKQAEWLGTHNHPSMTIEGHADQRGTSEYNLALGERRAESARKALADLGVPSENVKTMSYGKERPHAEGNHEGAWSQNRRDMMVINQ